MSSSVSDTVAYRAFCAAAAHDTAIFERFKRAAVYTQILEHVSYEQGLQYLTAIRAHAPDLLARPLLDKLRLNDSVGAPQVFTYDAVGTFSPTTLRYIKVAADLRAFDLPARGTAFEVGGGYGGQARIFKLLWPDWQYVIVDLPEALALALRFLSTLGADKGVSFVPGSTALVGTFTGDLFVSNYALTECAPGVHRGYIERIANNCVRGYITGNALETETLALLAPVGPQRSPEEPRTGAVNFLVRWGQVNRNR